MRIDWRKKLSSRKLWGLIAVFTVSVAVIFGADAGDTEKIAGLVTAFGSVAVYILAEGTVDASSKQGKKSRNRRDPFSEKQNNKR